MKLCLLSFVLCLMISCSEDKLPADILPKDQMIPVLIDIHLAEAAITNQALFGEHANQKAADYYDLIYKKHGITKEQFRKSFEFYSQHPALYKEMYDELIVKMTENETELKKAMPAVFLPSDTARLGDTIPAPDTTHIKLSRRDSLLQHFPGARR